jgi:acetyl-CoA carboxylase biotin carboxyl carrier protein
LTEPGPIPEANSGAGSEDSGWLETVRALVAVFERSDAREVRLADGALRIRLRRADEGHFRHIVAEPIIHHPVVLPADTGSMHEIRAPLTGIWYDAASPGASPYVQVGSHVEVGTVIGLIETMKIFNEISADAAGRVAQVHVRRADLVQANATLLTIDTADTASIWPQRG